MANSDWASEAMGDESTILTHEDLQAWIDNTFGTPEWQVHQENKRAAQSAIHFGGVKLPELHLTASELIAEHTGVLPTADRLNRDIYGEPVE